MKNDPNDDDDDDDENDDDDISKRFNEVKNEAGAKSASSSYAYVSKVVQDRINESQIAVKLRNKVGTLSPRLRQ